MQKMRAKFWCDVYVASMGRMSVDVADEAVTFFDERFNCSTPMDKDMRTFSDGLRELSKKIMIDDSGNIVKRNEEIQTDEQ